MSEILVSGKAFEAMLRHVNPEKSLPELLQGVKDAKSTSKKDILIKKIKYTNGLKNIGMSATDAFILHNMPVLPPQMRPVTIMAGNRNEFADVNQLYKDHMAVNNSLKEPIEDLPPELLTEERKQAYEGIKAVMGVTDTAISPNSRGRGLKGLIKQVVGTGGPKTGLFHNKILSKKQDFSGRATIYAEPNLGFNQAAVPESMLWTMYKFHILRDLSRQGYDYVSATKAWESKSPAAVGSFNRMITKIPVIINRAPTLMKSNITAVFPVPIKGSTMGLNPIHLPLFAGDYDGDALTLHVPMSPEAVAEARAKLLPQHQIHDYRRGLGQSIVQPGHEAILGSMHLTEPNMSVPVRKFKTEVEALAALKAGEIKDNDPIEIDDAK